MERGNQAGREEALVLAPFRSRGVRPYIFGIIGVVVATLFRSGFAPVLGEHLSFSFAFLAVFVAAWTGGMWPAIGTAILSALVSNYFFTESLGISSPEELFDLAFFVAISVIIGVLSEISLRAMIRTKQAEREKDNFMAAVAHEMRSPLSVIYYANTMNRLAGAEQSNDQLDIIDRQVHHLNLMIEDLLDVSRVARGKIKLKRQRVEVSVIVAGAVERARPLIESHQHVLKTQLPPRPVELFADPIRMEQVLANLLTNAAKYTPDGGEIIVRVEAVNGSVIFSVHDNGIGIEPEMLPRVFDMFAQANTALDRTEGGLGIGLALVRKIVEMHGGTVRAASNGNNRGSEFIVSLPIEQPAPTNAALARA
jgi:signal transduction histidine kinase